MRKKLLLWSTSIGLSIVLFSQGITAFADAEHLGELNETYTYVVPSSAVLKSTGKLDFSSGDNSILLDSTDIQYLQNELKTLYREIDTYKGSNLAGE